MKHVLVREDELRYEVEKTKSSWFIQIMMNDVLSGKINSITKETIENEALKSLEIKALVRAIAELKSERLIIKYGLGKNDWDLDWYSIDEDDPPEDIMLPSQIKEAIFSCLKHNKTDDKYIWFTLNTEKLLNDLDLKDKLTIHVSTREIMLPSENLCFVQTTSGLTKTMNAIAGCLSKNELVDFFDKHLSVFEKVCQLVQKYSNKPVDMDDLKLMFLSHLKIETQKEFKPGFHWVKLHLSPEFFYELSELDISHEFYAKEYGKVFLDFDSFKENGNVFSCSIKCADDNGNRFIVVNAQFDNDGIGGILGDNNEKI